MKVPAIDDPTSAVVLISTQSLLWALAAFMIVVIIVAASSIQLLIDSLSHDEYLARLSAVALMGTAYFAFLSPHRDRLICKGTSVLFFLASVVTFASASELYLPSHADRLVTIGPILSAAFLLALWVINATEAGDTRLIIDFLTGVFSRGRD